MWLKRLHRRQLQIQLRYGRIPIGLWEEVVNDALVHFALTPAELHRLRELSSLFLQKKIIDAAGDLEMDAYKRTVIAANACMLILNLNLDYYNGWREVIVYPGSFVIQHEVQDEIGVIHQERNVLGGEAWSRGPVILAWDDACPGSRPHGEGSNVILHEFAHKLDMLNGAANGMPPLHPKMNRQTWTRTFSRAFGSLQQQIIRHHRTRIDPYGAENPAEFFAVVSEEFFESPQKLRHYYPGIYDQLCLFYRQDPLKRLEQRNHNARSHS